MALDLDLTREVVKLCYDDNGFTKVKIGNLLGPVLNVFPIPVEFNAGYYGTFELGKKRSHLLFDFVGLADIGECPTTEFGSLSHEIGIGSRADADCKEATSAYIFLDVTEKGRFVADATIGDEEYLPHTVVIGGVVTQCQS